MSFKLSLNSTGTSSALNKTSSSGNIFSYGRVIDIILDENHPQYSVRGGGISINGIFYRPIKSLVGETDAAKLPFAFQSNALIKTVPLIGEIVRIEAIPTPSGPDFSGKTRKYYSSIVNIFNNPNNNFYPDTVNNPDIDLSQSNKFKELGDVNPIASSPGDLQIEGRHGQSLRFTGGKSLSNPWIDDSNMGKPLIILSNGQRGTDNGYSTIGEDVNEDASSIYLASDHQIPLVEANEKRETWDDKPTPAKEFKGNQIVLNGGRLFLNAKEHDIQLSSVKSIGLNTGGTINIDATEYMCVDGSQIFLGKKARTASERRKEPVMLGNQVEGFLLNVLNLLEGMADDMARARTIKNHPIPSINKRGIQAKPVIQSLKKLINPNGPSTLKSKKVFTE